MRKLLFTPRDKGKRKITGRGGRTGCKGGRKRIGGGRKRRKGGAGRGDGGDENEERQRRERTRLVVLR